MKRRNKILFWLLGAVLVAVAAVAIWVIIWWIQRGDDAPTEVSLEQAVSNLETNTNETDDPNANDNTNSGTASPGNNSGNNTVDNTSNSPGAGITGRWEVDTSIGNFNYEETASASFVGFRIQEELRLVGEITAVGRTPVVEGYFEITSNGATGNTLEVQQGEITADLSAITTEDSRRDDEVQAALDTRNYPQANFTMTSPVAIPSTAPDGEPFSFELSGNLTIKGVSRAITIPMQAQLSGEVMALVGSVEITFADWDVSVPSARIVVSAEDHGILEIQLFFRR